MLNWTLQSQEYSIKDEIPFIITVWEYWCIPFACNSFEASEYDLEVDVEVKQVPHKLE